MHFVGTVVDSKRPRLRERADEYRIQWKVELQNTTARLSDDIRAGGVAAKVVVIRQGNQTYFTTGRSGSVFDNRRKR